MSKFAVYSTFCGATNNATLNSENINSEYPHYFLSNNKEVLIIVKQLGWIPVYLDLEVSEDLVYSSHQSKLPKALPHLFPDLNEFDYLLYKDDKISLNIKEVAIFINHLKSSNSSIAVRSHPFLKDNILFEFGEAMLQNRYKSQWANTVNYITKRLSEGFKLDCQMYATGIILRNMRHTNTIDINNLWYEHILECGIECQISFDFVAQRFKTISILPESIIL